MDKSINERLGALRFQKVVFKVEELKFKFIDRFCPNIGNWYSSYCDKKVKKLCQNKNSDEQDEIRRNYNYRKMAFNKELVTKKNRNYHINLNEADSFQKYLQWNKSVHQRGMIKNLVCILGSSALMLLNSGLVFTLASIYLGYNIISLGINFQCVNLQNYNLKRLDEKKEVLKKMATRQRQKDVENYSSVGEVIYDKIGKEVNLPSSSDIVSSINNKEDLIKLRKLALEVKQAREQDEVHAQVKIKKR